MIRYPKLRLRVLGREITRRPYRWHIHHLPVGYVSSYRTLVFISIRIYALPVWMWTLC